MQAARGSLLAQRFQAISNRELGKAYQFAIGIRTRQGDFELSDPGIEQYLYGM